MTFKPTYAGHGSAEIVAVPWDDVVSALPGPGWAHVPAAIDTDLAERLADDDRRQWRLLGDEGGVHQHAFGSYTPFRETLPAVRLVGERLIAGLSETARRRGLPAPSDFNEATWGRYPAKSGRITVHSDPREYGGIIAVFTLRGHAIFRVFDGNNKPTEWETGPGQLALLRGAGWPCANSRCPAHEVDPPTTEERMIMTFRHNCGGAGAGYTV
ncbi:MAG TPA: hypothetical protein VKV06_01350 [Acidimicrobiales bacterium]|nr:hypothetical protein [Acidimicrobiales bacterium]